MGVKYGAAEYRRRYNLASRKSELRFHRARDDLAQGYMRISGRTMWFRDGDPVFVFWGDFPSRRVEIDIWT